MKYRCPACKAEVELFISHCPACRIPFSWLPFKGSTLPGIDSYRYERERGLLESE